MTIELVSDINRLKRINEALIARVERSMDQQGNAFTLFQTAINLDGRVRAKTDELKQTLRRLEQSNRDLSVAKEAAETANASKTRFIAAASHDVLQPLNAARLSVSGLADMLTEGEGARLVHQVERSLDTMEELLRTLLDISRLDSGVMQPEITAFHLQDVFDALALDFAPLAGKAGLKLRIRPTKLPIASDRMMFRRILQNILSNALRYTGQGGVLVAARLRGQTVLIEVHDTGIGISREQSALVFEEFHRSPEAASAHAGGLGLGLSIVRRMSSALGHRLEFSSTVGKGTLFRLAVPLAAAPLQAFAASGAVPGDSPVYGLSNAKVLLVENDLRVQEAMESLLGRWNCNTRVAASLGEAMTVLSGSGFRPDIILADQHLDRSTLGSQTITEARRLLKSNVPAIIITADPDMHLGQLAKAERIEVMQKPVRPAELRALMAHLLA
ncbi:MAG: ATP-binding protein [Rhizobiaceae bacterium]